MRSTISLSPAARCRCTTCTSAWQPVDYDPEIGTSSHSAGGRTLASFWWRLTCGPSYRRRSPVCHYGGVGLPPLLALHNLQGVVDLRGREVLAD